MPSRHRIYAFIVKCYPADFREHYGRELLQLFADLTNPRLPGYTPPNYVALYANGIWGAVKEQARSIRHKVMGDQSVPKPKFPLIRRPYIVAGIITLVVVIVPALASRFWQYDSPVQAAIRAYELGARITKVQDSVNFGYDDVASSFVNEYVDYTYYHKGNNRVGYNSDYAVKGTSALGTFDAAVKGQYKSMQPGFDPLICGTSVPKSVTYSTAGNPMNMLGLATVEADFTYADGSQGLVDYELELDQSKSTHGTWYVTGVTCKSLNNAANHPYVLRYEPTDNERTYDTRNDRVFAR
ncbi:MAG TPA: hypothetical protein VI322_00375 [Candidatus Saccharimonadia bacterium]